MYYSCHVWLNTSLWSHKMCSVLQYLIRLREASSWGSVEGHSSHHEASEVRIRHFWLACTSCQTLIRIKSPIKQHFTGSCQSFRHNVKDVTGLEDKLATWCTNWTVHSRMSACFHACMNTRTHTYIYSRNLKPCLLYFTPIPLSLSLSLCLWWCVVDELSADIIGTGPMWHCSDDPQKSRAHRCKQTLSLSLTQMLTHTHSHQPSAYSTSFHLTPVLQAPMILISLFWFQCHTDPISPLHRLLLSPLSLCIKHTLLLSPSLFVSLHFSSRSTSSNVPSFRLKLPSSRSHSDVYSFLSLPLFPLLQAGNMQIMPHKCKSLSISEETSSGEEESAQLTYTPLKCFPSVTEVVFRLFEGYLWNCWIKYYMCACALLRQSKASLCNVFQMEVAITTGAEVPVVYMGDLIIDTIM